MTVYVAPIVEGHTEADRSCERLLHRIWNDLLRAPIILQVLPPSRGKRDQLVSSDFPELSRKLEEAATKLAQRMRRDPSGHGLLLLFLDAEGDRPQCLAPELLARARAAMPAHFDICCVLAKRMAENWIVAGASSLAGKNGLPNSLPTRDRFEDRSGAAWLESQLRAQNRTRKYKKTVDFEIFVQEMDLQECRANSPSFDKLCRELESRLPQWIPTTSNEDTEQDQTNGEPSDY
jgi:hypothetical protein